VSVSIASCERSFSELKLIFTYLLPSIGQDLYDDLALLGIAKEPLQKFDCDRVIDDLPSSEARNVKLRLDDMKRRG